MSTESTKAALFETRYRNALTAYVQQEMEDALMEAFELGRKALAEGQGLLDLVAIHHTLLASLIEQSSNGGRHPTSCGPGRRVPDASRRAIRNGTPRMA